MDVLTSPVSIPTYKLSNFQFLSLNPLKPITSVDKVYQIYLCKILKNKRYLVISLSLNGFTLHIHLQFYLMLDPPCTA